MNSAIILFLVCLALPVAQVPQFSTTDDRDALERLEDIVGRAEVVVIGIVESYVDRGDAVLARADGYQEPGRAVLADVRMTAVIKGQPPARLQVLIPARALASTGRNQFFSRVWTSSPPRGSSQVFFLEQRGGQFFPTDVSLPCLYAVAPGQELGPTPFERVIGSVAAVMDAPDSLPQAKVAAQDVLDGVSHPASSAALRKQLKASAGDFRLQAAVSLLLRDDLSGLEAAETALREGDARDKMLISLRFAIAEGLKDPAAVPSLGRLLENQDARTRRAAAKALSRTHSPKGIPILARALNDADAEVNFWAVVGLRDMTNQGGMLSREWFEAHREEQLAGWKAWARERGLIK